MTASLYGKRPEIRGRAARSDLSLKHGGEQVFPAAKDLIHLDPLFRQMKMR